MFRLGGGFGVYGSWAGRTLLGDGRRSPGESGSRPMISCATKQPLLGPGFRLGGGWVVYGGDGRDSAGGGRHSPEESGSSPAIPCATKQPLLRPDFRLGGGWVVYGSWRGGELSLPNEKRRTVWIGKGVSNDPQKVGSAAKASRGRLQPSSRSKRDLLRKRRNDGAV